MLYKIGVPKTTANFTGKHRVRVFFNQVIKKRLQHSCFSVKFAKILRTPFYRTPLVAASYLLQIIIFNPSMTNAFLHREISMGHFGGEWFEFCSINFANKPCSEENTQILSAIFFQFRFY